MTTRDLPVFSLSGLMFGRFSEAMWFATILLVRSSSSLRGYSVMYHQQGAERS